MRKPLLLGLDNPHLDGTVLDPSSPGSHAGRRLFALSGMTLEEYEEAFDRANAIDVGNRTSPIFEDRTTLVLGREAWRVIGLPATGFSFFDEFSTSECRFVMVPHPSGRCRFYNSQENRDIVGRLLRRTACR